MWKFICAFVTRALFLLMSLVGVYRVIWAKKDRKYWFLTLLFLPQVAEMIFTLKMRRGKDYKWCSPAVLLFLVSIIPSIWILELHHQQNRSNEPGCNTLDSWESLIKSFDHQNRTLKNNTSIQEYLNSKLDLFNSSVCPKEWILTLHMILLLLLIFGKWLLPIAGGVTKDELSQLLLIFVGTAADILEFTSETASVTIGETQSFQLLLIILAVWTWSMLQFPLHLAANTKPEDEGDQNVSLLTKHRTDLWSVSQALFIQDGPFLVVRLIVLIHFQVFNQMLVFFTIKNSLLIMLNLYRLTIICQGSKSTSSMDI